YRQSSRKSRGRARRFPGVKWSDHRSAAQSCQRGTVPPAMPHVGSSARRGDDPRLLTGRGRYVDDVTLPRMVHVAFVRSPHAHARVVGIDAGDARRAPGVACVLTGGDTARLCKPYRGILEHYRGMKTGAMLPLATDRVRYVGEPVAVVAAEPRGLVAELGPATRALSVWISTQVPHMMQAVLADLVGLREHRVRVIAPDVGKSFGIKIHVYQDDLAAVALALTLGGPVKFVA